MVQGNKEAGTAHRTRPGSTPGHAGDGSLAQGPIVDISERDHPLVIGIGASAGGLDAFKAFFAKMPLDSGMAFVLVQHLNPDHKSILTELIARQTGMTVSQAEDGMPIRPDMVFVIPPDSTLTIGAGRLNVERPAPPRQNRHPIDAFFTSLAESQGENAVGIVLAGTGSDGSVGIRAIKAHGGLTLAQAGFDHVALSGMPHSAAATGLVDHVMQVGNMPARLIEYERHLKGVAALKDGDGARRDMEDHLTTISGLLRAAVGHDFGQYRHNTLGRRVQRRMQVLQIDAVPEFIDRLRRDPPQLELLFREFLIGVTQFFRDPEAFEALRAKGFPLLLRGKQPHDPLRIWVPACATGEEVYSIAILLKEEMEKLGIDLPVQMFGTDIDDSAVATARAAYYPRAMTGMSPERLERWFVPHGDGYCPVKQIREMCIFSVHSVIRDPPFSKLDLISCRNLMIYLDGELQERIARSFHYALKPGAILFLGPSEGLTRGTKRFGLLDKRHRVFERRATDSLARLPEFSTLEIGTGPPRRAAPPTVATGADLIDRHARSVLENYSPAYVVIDQQYEVLRFSGGAIGHYLEPSSGLPSLNLFALLRKTLRPSVRAAVQKVFAEGQTSLQQQISIKIGGESHLLRVIAAPLSGGRNEAGLCVVALQDLGVVSNKQGKRAVQSKDGTPDALERELQVAKAQILALAADLETANEEAASSAEEYQSINEELQSSNEELETAKEEMQSINEELQTVNAELNSKNDQLMRSNSDLQNLLESTQIATVFLDSDLRVKGYTPAMTELFHLREADRGRPLDEISSRINYGDLREDVLTVLRDLKTVEREVEIASSGATFIMRIRPYRTLEHAVDGVVITFVDISGRKKMEETLREHAAIVEFSQDALISMTLDGVIRSWNPGAEHLFGYTAQEAIGKPIAFLGGADRNDKQSALIEQAKDGKVAGPVGAVRLRQGGENVDVELAIMPIRGSDGAVTALALSARDIAERTAADTHRTLLLRELSHRVKNALATVQAVAMQTLRTATTPKAFAASFSARLMALAKTHDLLTQGEWQGAALRDVMNAELTPYQNESHTRWNCDGPVIQLEAKTALALGMAFHELATNAAKHGALSIPSGHVYVTWERQVNEAGSRLHLVWAEREGPPVQISSHKGFGTRLISDGLAYELDGEVRLDFDAAGFRCVIDVPLSRQEAGP
jgi:two-component system, chemotaxis family, CheB/CheR fusion protein